MNDLERIEYYLITKVPKVDLQDLEVLRQSLLNMRVEKYIELAQSREKCRHPKDKDLTDWDRRVMNDAMVAELQAEYDYLVGLEELVKERLIAC